MRLISFINALLVIVALYFLVFERDALFAFAGKTETATESADDEAADVTVVNADTAMGVVALRSTAREIDSAVVLRGQT